MRPARARAVNRTLVLVAFGAMLAGGATATARADGILNATEAGYVHDYGRLIVCAPLSGTPAPATVIAVTKAVMQDGFAPDNAVDIVNASVLAYCDEHWPLLQRVGAMARGEHV